MGLPFTPSPTQINYSMTLSIKAPLATIMPRLFSFPTITLNRNAIEEQATSTVWQLQYCSSLADIVFRHAGICHPPKGLPFPVEQLYMTKHILL